MNYLGLDDVLAIASAVLRVEPEVLMRTSRINSADSAVHATHDAIGAVPIRRDWNCQLPLQVAEHELIAPAQIDRWRHTAVALVELDELRAPLRPT